MIWFQLMLKNILKKLIGLENPTPESLNDVNEWAFSIIEPIFENSGYSGDDTC